MKPTARFAPVPSIRVTFAGAVSPSVLFTGINIDGEPCAWATDLNSDGNVELFGVAAEAVDGDVSLGEENIRCEADGGDVQIFSENSSETIANNSIRVVFGR